LTTSPDKSALTGAGALPWAGGSQKWKGKMAVFSIRPSSTSTNAARHGPSAGWPAANEGMSSTPQAPYSTTTPARYNSEPASAASQYRNAASVAARVPATATSATAVNVSSSSVTYRLKTSRDRNSACRPHQSNNHSGQKADWGSRAAAGLATPSPPGRAAADDTGFPAAGTAK